MLDDEVRFKVNDHISEDIDKLKTLDPGSKEYKDLMEGCCKMIDSFTKSEAELSNSFHQQEMRRIEEEDRIERRKIEKKKNKKMAKIEKKKTELTKGKAAMDIFKTIFGPLVGILVVLIKVVASKDELVDTFKFEETGRINSSGGRSHKRPNFWSKD